MLNSKKELKNHLMNLTGAKTCLLTSSARNALYLLIKSLNLNSYDEVIIQSFICDSLPWAIENAGAKVVKVEVDKNTLNLSLQTILPKINQKTKAIVFVHTYGNPSGIDQIAKFCESQNIILIEDIAHALRAKSYDNPVGSFGDFAIYSFTKQLKNTGGGALLINQNQNSKTPTNKIISTSKQIQRGTNKKQPLLEMAKKYVASLYETRANFIARLLIRKARKNANLKLTNYLNSHMYCSYIDAYFALRSLIFLEKDNKKRQKNYNFLKQLFKKENSNQNPLQTIHLNNNSTINYLSFKFPNNQARDNAHKNYDLFLPPWQGTPIANQLAFIPNNPNFSKSKLRFIAKIYNQSIQESKVNDNNYSKNNNLIQASAV